MVAVLISTRVQEVWFPALLSPAASLEDPSVVTAVSQWRRKQSPQQNSPVCGITSWIPVQL